MTSTVASLFAIGFVVMVLLGYFIIAVVCAGRISSGLTWAFSPVVGMGASFIIHYIFRRPMVTVEVSLLVLLFVVRLLQKRSTSAQEGLRARAPLYTLWLAGVLSWMTMASFVWVAARPHGEWDGWAIWNAHARYIYRAGPVWQQHISNTAHPDYPLLIPLTNSRSWRYVGKDVPHLSGVHLVLIGVSGVLILAASLWELRANSLSLLIPLLLVGTPFYLMLGVWQYADMPLSIYILATLALLCFQRLRDPDGSRLLILAGFAAGCAASTKNEGLLFVVAVLLAQLLVGFRQLAMTIRRILMFSAGLLLPLVMTLHFKFTVPPPNDITGNRAFDELLAKIMDPERYLTIADAFLKTAGSFGHWPIHPGIPLLAVLIFWGIDRTAIRSEAWRIGALSVAIVLAGYFAVYVVTPLSLDYHLPASLDRLLMHVWPSILFLAGLAAGTRSSELPNERGPTRLPST
jgi:hypothetical protein